MTSSTDRQPPGASLPAAPCGPSAGEGGTSGASVAVDHLVVGAADLAQAAAYARGTLGAQVVAGGKHPLMGTHNALLRLQGEAGEGAYLEFIAIDPEAPAPPRPRWFGLDRPEVQQALREAPRLLHWVARCDDPESRRAALLAQGLDPGAVIELTRGALRWRMSVREDGGLAARGALPTLIAWAGAHPTAALPPSGIALRRLRLRGLPAAAVALLGLEHVPGLAVEGGSGPALGVELMTPRGAIGLASPEL